MVGKSIGIGMDDDTRGRLGYMEELWSSGRQHCLTLCLTLISLILLLNYLMLYCALKRCMRRPLLCCILPRALLGRDIADPRGPKAAL